MVHNYSECCTIDKSGARVEFADCLGKIDLHAISKVSAEDAVHLGARDGDGTMYIPKKPLQGARWWNCLEFEYVGNGPGSTVNARECVKFSLICQLQHESIDEGIDSATMYSQNVCL